MYDQKKIGAAKYLKKDVGDYIPFRIGIADRNCS